MTKQLSDCCKAEIKTGGIGDFHDKDRVRTQYYVCTKCNEPCDILNMNNNWEIELCKISAEENNPKLIKFVKGLLKDREEEAKEEIIESLQNEYDRALDEEEMGESNGYAHAIAIVKQFFN